MRMSFAWKWKNVLFVIFSLFLSAGCVSDKECRSGAVTQVATIDSLLVGVFDGSMSLGELKEHGNFGIGTFDKLDGEMLLLDGTVYQVKADGKIYLPPDTMTTPFASVCYFRAAHRKVIQKPLNYQALCGLIDEMAPNKNIFVAVRVKGDFSAVKTRSVPAQSKPYKTLVEVTRHQPEFELGTVSGKVIGYRLPNYVKGINVPGYHLHFISDDCRRGGHLLNLQLENGVVEVGEIYEFNMILPKKSAGFEKADLNKDRSQELKQAEGSAQK